MRVRDCWLLTVGMAWMAAGFSSQAATPAEMQTIRRLEVQPVAPAAAAVRIAPLNEARARHRLEIDPSLSKKLDAASANLAKLPKWSAFSPTCARNR